MRQPYTVDRDRLSKAQMLDIQTADDELAALSHDRKVQMATLALAGWEIKFHVSGSLAYSYWVAVPPTRERVHTVFRYQLDDAIYVAWSQHHK